MKYLYLMILPLLFAACNKPATKSTVVINEICGKDADGLEWIEVANASDAPVNLKGYKLIKMDTDGIEKTLYTFPDTIVAPGAIVTVNKEDLKAKLPSSKQLIVELLSPTKETLDYFDSDENLDVEGHPAGGSYARVPNITGGWILSKTATWNAPNVDAPVPAAQHEVYDDLDDDDDED